MTLRNEFNSFMAQADAKLKAADAKLEAYKEHTAEELEFNRNQLRDIR